MVKGAKATVVPIAGPSPRPNHSHFIFHIDYKFLFRDERVDERRVRVSSDIVASSSVVNVLAGTIDSNIACVLCRCYAVDASVFARRRVRCVHV
jgi:hypothetical protein